MEYVKALQLWGIRGTYRHLYMFKRIKMGTLVGTDEFGNKYFENKDYPYGQHRWIEHKNWDSQQLADASTIPPLWHPWMHYMTDAVPTNNQIPEMHRSGKQLIAENDTPVDNHYNTAYQKEWRPNATLKRARGYNIGSYPNSAVAEDGFYTQPGHPMSPYKAVNTQHVQAWDGAPTGTPNMPPTEQKLSAWQQFYRQRQAMNQK